MASLRTNNLSGEGGRNAYRGSVFFDGRDTISGTQVIAAESNDDFTLGTGDFALEMWIYPAVVQSKTLYDGRRASSDVAMHIDLSSNVVRYMTNNNARITGSSTLAVNSWHHISVERASGSTKLYVNGVQEGSTYSDNNNLVAKLNRPIIGSSYSMYSTFKGYISNVRLCKGHTVYGAAFTPPSSELVVHDKTVLLCCQDSDDPLQEATGKEMLGQGGCYRGRRFSNLATNGDLETGASTNWNNGGLETFEVVTDHPHSGSYSLHCVTNSNGDACSYTIPVTLDTEKRYKISAYVKVVGPGGTSARAKMKIGSGTGGNENFESQVLGQGYNGFKWGYVEWIGMATSDTTHVTFNESSSNDVNDYYVDDLKIELWYPEEGVNILGNNNFLDNATGWSFSNGNSPSSQWAISSHKLTVSDTSRTNDAVASQQVFSQAIAEGRYRFTVDYNISVGDFDIGFGSKRLYGIRSTYNGGAGDDATVTYEVHADDNSSFRLVANQYCAGDFNSIHLSRVPEPKAPKVIPPYGVDAGNTFDGAINMNSLGHMQFPTGTTDERGRGRGLRIANYIATNSSNYNTTEFITIQSMGNSQDFGDASAAVRGNNTLASSTRAISASGYVAPSNVTTIEFFTIATTGNAQNFGSLQGGAGSYAPISNQTRGVFAGGYAYPSLFNNIDYITIATTGNSIDFGGLTTLRADGNRSAVNSSTRGLIGGGYIAPTGTNNIEFITIATTGNSQDFGDLTAARGNFAGLCSSTRGVFAGGTNPSNNIIDFVTIASTGDAVNFGDLITGNTAAHAGTSNQTRGVFMGGDLQPSNAFTNTIQHVTIATTGNTQDFGDMLTVGAYGNATSDSHGGLS